MHPAVKAVNVVRPLTEGTEAEKEKKTSPEQRHGENFRKTEVNSLTEGNFAKLPYTKFNVKYTKTRHICVHNSFYQYARMPTRQERVIRTLDKKHAIKVSVSARDVHGSTRDNPHLQKPRERLQ